MAQEETFTIDQGADVAIQLYLVNTDGSPKNLTNHLITAKMKKNFNSDSADTTEFISAVMTPPTDGIITLSLTNTQTDQLKSGRYVYDVEITKTSNGEKTRVVEGQVTINPGVTV